VLEASVQLAVFRQYNFWLGWNADIVATAFDENEDGALRGW
jgi:hypothetical protein